MKRPPLYSHSPRAGAGGASSTALTDRAAAKALGAHPAADAAPGSYPMLGHRAHRHDWRLWRLVPVPGAAALRWHTAAPVGGHVPTDLIPFDTAANPGNSDGPLATMDGEVAGIVTAILNPTEQGVFVGIGFAVPIENAPAGPGLSPF